MVVNIIKITGPAGSGKSTMFSAFKKKLDKDGIYTFRIGDGQNAYKEIPAVIERTIDKSIVNIFIDDIMFQDYIKLEMALHSKKIFDRAVNIYVASRDRI